MTLEQTISDWQDENIESIPAEIRAVMQQATRDLIDQGLAGQARQPGDLAPEFMLATSDGRSVSLAKVRARGPVVLNFYRGAWCPYCNMELRALNAIVPEIENRRASLLGINPNKTEVTAEFIQDNPFDFEILSDPGNETAREYGLVFALPDPLISAYRELGIDLPSYDGNERWELPMPATYVVDTDGRIQAGFVHADYTRRMEPAVILAALDRC